MKKHEGALNSLSALHLIGDRQFKVRLIISSMERHLTRMNLSDSLLFKLQKSAGFIAGLFPFCKKQLGSLIRFNT